MRPLFMLPERTGDALAKEFPYAEAPTTHGLPDKYFEACDLADEDVGASVGPFE